MGQRGKHGMGTKRTYQHRKCTSAGRRQSASMNAMLLQAFTATCARIGSDTHSVAGFRTQCEYAGPRRRQEA